MRRFWTLKEIEYLTENMHLPRKQIAEDLGRNVESVYGKIRDVQKYGAVTSISDVYELVIKHAYIKSDKDISRITGAPIRTVNTLKEKLFDKEKNRPYKYSTLCFYCAKATGGCSWTEINLNGKGRPENKSWRPIRFKPVEGWTAEAKEVRVQNNTTRSYKVVECPLYERG